jgi:tetratricopeptide (TPR) repeat protein
MNTSHSYLYKKTRAIIALILIFSLSIQSCNISIEPGHNMKNSSVMQKLREKTKVSADSQPEILAYRSVVEDIDLVKHVANYIECNMNPLLVEKLQKLIYQTKIESTPTITAAANSISLLVAADHKFSEDDKKSMSQSREMRAIARLAIEQWRKTKANVIQDDKISWKLPPTHDFINHSYGFVETQMSQMSKFLSDIESQKLQQDPNIFQVPTHNANFVGREEELIKIKKSLSENKILCIVGSGGLGKTELATEYLSRSEYEKIIWLFAEYGQLFSQIQTYMHRVYGIAPGTLKQEELLPIFYNKLGDNACIVIDNAENLESISEFSPKNQQFDILITSRYKSWDFTMIDLGSFSAEDTYKYVHKVLGDEREILEKDSQELHNLVDGLPLAVVQAAAYIKQKGSITLLDYCKLFTEKSEEALKSGDPENPTVSTTLTIALDDIRKKDLYVDEIMNIASYLSSDNITTQLLSNFFLLQGLLSNSFAILNGLNKTINLLVTYSIFSTSDKSFKFHRLSQSVMRMIHRKRNVFDNNFEKATNWLLPQLKYNEIDLQDVARVSPLVPHGLAMCEIEGVEEKYWEKVWLMYMYSGNHQLSAIQNAQQGKFCFEKASIIAGKNCGLDHPNTVTAMESLGDSYCSLGDHKISKGILDDVLIIIEKNLGPYHPRTGIALTNLGRVHISLGNFEKAKDFLERALIIKEKSIDRDEIVLTNLAIVYRNLGNFKKAKDLLEKVLVIHENTFGLHHPKTGNTLDNLGGVYISLKDFKKAKDTLERALIINEKNFGPDHPNTGMTLTNLGGVHIKLGNSEKARDLLERALSIHEKNFGPDHPNIVMTLTSLGGAHIKLRNFEKAKDLLDHALIITEKIFGPDHPTTGMVLENLGNAHMNLYNFEKAKDFLERALIINKEKFGLYHPNTESNLTNLCIVHKNLGNLQREQELLAHVLVINEKQFGLEHANTEIILTDLGIVHSNLGNFEEAKDLLERILIINKKNFGQHHTNTGIALANLGKTYQSLGDLKKAFELFEQAYRIFFNFPGFGVNHPYTKSTRKSLENINNSVYNEFLNGISILKIVTTYNSKHRNEKCHILTEKLYRIFLKFYGPDHQYTKAALHQLQLAIGNNHLVSKKEKQEYKNLENNKNIIQNMEESFVIIGSKKIPSEWIEQIADMHEDSFGSVTQRIEQLHANLPTEYTEVVDSAHETGDISVLESMLYSDN